MAPTIVTKAGKPVFALGSPGGATIITTVLQILLDRVDLGLTLPQAIADPRASQRNAVNTGAEPAFLSTPERTALETRAITSRTPVRSAPQPRSSSSRAAACSPLRSLYAAAGAVR
jgi:gamma-glutamyltranspeptidase / glutathione hydrolase